MYALRFFMPTDWELWKDLHHEAYRPRVEALWGWDAEKQLDFAKLEFEKPYDGKYVVVVGGQDAGYLSLNWEEGEMYLSNFVLRADLRGQGMGEAILRDLQKVAAARKCGIRLQTFTNNPARRLYERMGFVLVEENDNKHFILRWRPA